MRDTFTGAHFAWSRPETVWRQLLRPWFSACARIGWESPHLADDQSDSGDFSEGAGSDSLEPKATGSFEATAVTNTTSTVPMLLAPDAGMIAWIKGRLVAEGLGCLGVHFHTVGTLRGLLAQAYGVEGRIALREDLHLLLGQAARSLPDNPVAQAATLDPVALSRLCDRIDRAGWRAEGFSTAAGRQLAVRYFELLAAQGLRTVADVERELLERAEKTSTPACGYLLAVGFGCEHSDSLLLLRAAALSARQPILCLDTVPSGSVATSATLSWQASCEEYFGLAQPLADDEASAPVAQTDAESTGGEDGALLQEADVGPADTAALRSLAKTSKTPEGVAENSLQPLAGEEDALFQWAAQSELQDAASASPLSGTAAATTEPSLPAVHGSPASLASALSAAHEALAPSAALEALAPSAALEAWAQALAEHRSVEPSLRQTLQHALRLLTFRTLDEEARHTVHLVRHWLKQSAQAAFETASLAVVPPPLRIGIVLPGDGSLLGREIAAGLSAHGIAHYDSLGHQPPPTPAQRLLEGWCNWQNNNQIDDFNAFASELSRQGLLSPADLRHWERAVDKALSQTLCAELGVVAAFLSGGDSSLETGLPKKVDSPSQQAVKQILELWPQLPEQASFETFWAQAQPVLALLGWPQRPEPLLERAAVFEQTLTGRLPRSAFIGWLRAVSRMPGRTRNALGHEPFAQVHLVTLAEAGRQRWSHLCVVGMVHGQWPPLEADSALLDPERCAELNRRAERPSRFGEGQPCIGGSHTFLVGARQHREAFDAAFLRLFGQCGAGRVVLSRYRFEPSAQQAEAFASEYFLRSLYAATGSLDIEESAQLPAVSPAPAYPQVAFAYSHRRDPNSGFDAYSYALSSAPPEPLRLSCSHWAEVLNRPAHAWYRYVLKVRKRRRAGDSDFRLQSQGIWVHHWLNPSAGRRWGEPPCFVPRPNGVQWLEQVAVRAQALRNRIAAVYIRAGRQLPQWWQSDWSAAQAVAESFAQALGGTSVYGSGAAVGGGSTSGGGAGTIFGDAAVDAATGQGVVPRSDVWGAAGGEWPLAPLRLDLPGHPLDGLLLEGIVDLLLADDAMAADVLTGTGERARAPVAPDLWVVDYKTGADAALSLKSWESKGVGLQLVLYAFALRARGAGAVRMTMLRKNASLEPQLELDDLSPEAEIWRKLALPMRGGIFGMRGLLRDPHSFNGDYPVATLGIDPVVLERKARLTFAIA